ncbi:class I SAM-dependent methyltransferase [Microcoleus sp. FACHB-68]|uniref:class I SAM-dependent methyltransferase n=1 Tax=Microcoleus sp. FACHB-68 TaxID=2692826 RepID=UPI0016831865|nr:class I SAM-dependent methyltransferase [Microcoleus sp. FACHB-68]MBD1939044.1 class I SAM-dependent methyltransferase [Microcoleus sp. FACHB-68]
MPVNNKEQLFDLWAPSYDSLFPSVIYQAIHQRLLEYIDLPPQPNVLDLGCGTGRLLSRLAATFPDLRGTGLDLSAQMIRQARSRNHHRPRLIYIQGNALALPFADGQFNAIFNTLSFLHYPSPEQVFAEVSRVLQKGGKFYLVDITTNQQSQPHYLGVSPGDIRFYSSQARELLGIESGFNCVGHYYLLGPVLLTIFAHPS